MHRFENRFRSVRFESGFRVADRVADQVANRVANRVATRSCGRRGPRGQVSSKFNSAENESAGA